MRANSEHEGRRGAKAGDRLNASGERDDGETFEHFLSSSQRLIALTPMNARGNSNGDKPSCECATATDCEATMMEPCRTVDESVPRVSRPLETDAALMRARQKVSEAILNLQAANRLREEIENYQQARLDRASWAQHEEFRGLREIVGDVGTVLFNPLDESAFLDPPIAVHDKTSKTILNSPTSVTYCARDASAGSHAVDEHDTRRDSRDDLFVFKHEVFPVQLAYESEEDLLNAPRVLTESMFHAIVNDALPRSLRIYKWKRLFAIARDGDAFITMLERCASFKNTLIAIRTTEGNVLGGFASEEWRDQEGFTKRHSYFGTGCCFLFSDHPKTASGQEEDLNIYRWTGTNDYCQICDVERQFLAMVGGGGEFGLCIEDSFLHGSTGPCATFGNPCLVPGIDGTFEIQELEVWGLVPLFPTVFKPLTKKYSDSSLFSSAR